MKTLIVFLWFSFLASGFPWASPVWAQKTADKPFILGIIDEIPSTRLGEKRILNLYLPDDYQQNKTARYPVIYLLDGSANEDFVHIVGLVQFCQMIQILPKSIVVGIANVDRKRDFTFPTTIAEDKANYPTTGGSARFMAFLEKELQPFIQKKYRTNGSRTLIGQSLGGLLATEILLKKPDLFTTYLIVSPSLWWDNESLLAKAPQFVSQSPDPPRQVYISVGSEGKQMEDDARKLADVLRQSGQKNQQVIFAPLPDENHLTILHESIYRAFKTLNPNR
ncbi:alpha/beta hydrolase [Larkinella bovis]|uniref:Alpha/beta hydrolase n=1 Tax=Larkinella bovis TaxID=683041 RepID=A0ABW0IB17_9BACT